MTDHHNENVRSEEDLPDETTVGELRERNKGESAPTATPEADATKSSDESWPQSGFGSFP